MTRRSGVFPVMCPIREPGVGPVAACWPDQKPLRVPSAWPLTVRPPAVSIPRPTPVRVPNAWLEVGCRMLADQLAYISTLDPHRDSHSLAVVQIVSGAVV